MLISVAGVIAPTIKAQPPVHAVKGVLYIDGEIYNSTPIDVKIDFNGWVFNETTFPFDGEYNYNVGIYGNETETGDISVYYSGQYHTPVDNSTVYIHVGEPEEIYLDLHVNTSGGTPNNPPNTPSKISPGSTTTDTTPNLRWNGGDPDGDDVTYDVYFGNTSPPPQVVGNHSSTTYSPGTLDYKTYYWKIVAWDEHGASAEGAVWQFTVKTSPPYNPPYNPPTTDNQKPTAKANGPYSGFIDEEITFDGSGSSDSDGTITNYTWDFGDGTTGYGETTTHAYSSPGNYSVTLTVKDDEGASDDDESYAIISQPNLPPTDPIVNGPENGTQNTEYNFTAQSTDLDINDTIQYIFEWGDGETTTTEFLPSGTATTQTHSWADPGEYTINVTAYDNATASSETTEFVISIEEEKEPTSEEEYDYTWLILLLILIIILLILIYLISKRKKPEEKKQPPKKSSGKSGKKKK